MTLIDLVQFCAMFDQIYVGNMPESTWVCEGCWMSEKGKEFCYKLHYTQNRE